MSTENLSSKFYEGNPCVKCGSVVRNICDNKCINCHRERSQKWAQANLEKCRERCRKWRRAIKENPVSLTKIIYEGKSCVKCGSVRRYVSDKRCIVCCFKKVQKWRKENPEKHREYDKKCYQKTPEKHRERSLKWAHANPEKRHENYKKRYQENPEKFHERNRKWTQSNPERKYKLVRKWQQANLEKWQAIRRTAGIKNKAKRMGAEGFYSAQQLIDLYKEYNNQCLDCGIHESELAARSRKAERHLTPDHIIPLSRDGTNWISNIQPLCLSCNIKNWKHYLKTGSQVDFRPAFKKV